MSSPKVADGQLVSVFGSTHRQAQQCCAKSKRSGVRCRRASVADKAVCHIHGGKSTGPRTDPGRQAQIDGVTVHGRETRAKRERRADKLRELKELESLAKSVGMLG